MMFIINHIDPYYALCCCHMAGWSNNCNEWAVAQAFLLKWPVSARIFFFTTIGSGFHRISLMGCSIKLSAVFYAWACSHTTPPTLTVPPGENKLFHTLSPLTVLISRVYFCRSVTHSPQIWQSHCSQCRRPLDSASLLIFSRFHLQHWYSNELF